MAYTATGPVMTGKQILIVEDEVATLESLEFTLGDDYTVFTAANGQDGLEILEGLKGPGYLSHRAMRFRASSCVTF